jgi:hypothetical protein
MAYIPHKNAEGKRCPGASTISKVGEDTGGLVYAANKEGLQGNDIKDVWYDRMTGGTCAHYMMECDIRGKEPDLSQYNPEVLKLARTAYSAYEKWRKQTKMRPSKTELRLFSEKYQFGGMIDAVLISDELCLGDWKCTNSLYPSHLIQLIGGYSLLWKENFPDHPIKGYHILRFGKDNPDFSHHYWEDIPECRKIFLHQLQVYNLLKPIKKRV